MFQELRETLDGRPPDNTAAEYLNEHSPKCECEAAACCEGGHGQVMPDEILTYFITHPQHTRHKVKDPKKLAADPFGFKAQIFDAAFSSGISVIREGYATDSENVVQAEKLFSRLQRDKPDEGGILFLLQFPASAVINIVNEQGDRCYCIYDTPIDVGVENKEVLSHGDVFATANGSELRAARTSLRVQIHSAVSGTAAKVDLSGYRDNILIPYLAVG